MGKVKVRIKHAIHKAETAMDTAGPRMLLGKISAISTQVTGDLNGGLPDASCAGVDQDTLPRR